jgi:hypothetical protein
MHRIKTVDNGRGTWNKMKKMNGRISGMLEDRV